MCFVVPASEPVALVNPAWKQAVDDHGLFRTQEGFSGLMIEPLSSGNFDKIAPENAKLKAECLSGSATAGNPGHLLARKVSKKLQKQQSTTLMQDSQIRQRRRVRMVDAPASQGKVGQAVRIVKLVQRKIYMTLTTSS